ncbi:MAG: SufS family cysteine desulfurase [Myxococcales bacterium]|nr:SufS family cysteine desulfurase [Myxococcales bacterium]
MNLWRDFPALDQAVHGKPLVYLDSAATSQKPRAVIDAISRFYEQDNANVHRGVHALAERATAQLEDARERVRRFINAARADEIVFVRGVTEAVNLVADSFESDRDEIVVTALEHHSNLVPWQRFKVRVAGVDDRGDLRLDELEKLIGPRTRLVAAAHVSNALGTINPVEKIVKLAHDKGVAVLLDGAQAAPHLKVDVQRIGCDFYAFSAHKMYGPMGIGVLYGKAALLDAMRPWQRGGEMVQKVSWESATYQKAPYRFEAGTPDVAAAVGLRAAIEWLSGKDLLEHEQGLLRRGIDVLQTIPGVRLLGAPRERIGILTFTVEGVHPHDVGTVLDQEGIAVRTGHLCAQPLLERFGQTAVVRASLAAYSRPEDLDALGAGLHKVRETFG